MKETIKKSFISGLVFLLTIIIGSITYAAVSGTVTSGTTLTAQMWNDMAGNYDYSTLEVNTGKKWINGKPIYRTVVDLGDLSGNANDSNTYFNVDFNQDKNIETSVSANVIYNNDTNIFSTYHVSGTNQFRIKYGADYFGGVASSSLGWRLDNVKIITEYTKTTD